LQLSSRQLVNQEENMATKNNTVRKAQERLSRNLGEPTINEALSVLDKAVTGLIKMAKADAAEGASGKRIE
jgi:hypothetical protein